jgi:hypothetical protein
MNKTVAKDQPAQIGAGSPAAGEPMTNKAPAKNAMHSLIEVARQRKVDLKMDRQVTVRCNGDDAARLEELQARLPALSLSAVAREAMRVGLEAIAGDPARLIRPVPKAGNNR